uniref:Uncharacterized protein n=1 Tax=Anopheles atroparvus TaxID=41427 RepID=A0AAG5DC13_ANOAO
ASFASFQPSLIDTASVLVFVRSFAHSFDSLIFWDRLLIPVGNRGVIKCAPFLALSASLLPMFVPLDRLASTNLLVF